MIFSETTPILPLPGYNRLSNSPSSNFAPGGGRNPGFNWVLHTLPLETHRQRTPPVETRRQLTPPLETHLQLTHLFPQIFDPSQLLGKNPVMSTDGGAGIWAPLYVSQFQIWPPPI